MVKVPIGAPAKACIVRPDRVCDHCAATARFARTVRTMKIEGDIGIEAPRDQVFRRLSDAHFFASCIDGVQNLAATDAARYQATFTTRIAYMRFTFKIGVEMTRLVPPHEIEARMEGTPIGVVGRLTATAYARLREDGTRTLVRYMIDATLTGKLGSIGEPVLRAKAREMEQQFSERLLAAFAPGAEAAP